MTNYQKSQVSDHFNRWGIAYSMATFCLIAVLAIGWEARQEQKIKELEEYHQPTQNYEDVA